ncbi:HipA N-terminal domain-containing protein, partial [Cobetia litoralis]|uniref:HipA N-terminal domain-containing protein n=1 Tax=Cobetia amphilecti TaxID=1055104 RepID=UPI00244D6BB8
MILPDSLNVWRDTQHVGMLWRGTDGRLMGFEYNDTWRQNGHAISYSLPLSQKAWQPQDLLAHHWFANLLP